MAEDVGIDLRDLAEKVQEEYRHMSKSLRRFAWSGIRECYLGIDPHPVDGIQFNSNTFTELICGTGLDLPDGFRVPEAVAKSYNVPFRAELWKSKKGGKIAVMWRSDLSEDRYIAQVRTDDKRYMDTHKKPTDINWNYCGLPDEMICYRRSEVFIIQKGIGLDDGHIKVFDALYEMMPEISGLSGPGYSEVSFGGASSFVLSVWRESRREMLGVHGRGNAPDQIIARSLALANNQIEEALKLILPGARFVYDGKNNVVTG